MPRGPLHLLVVVVAVLELTSLSHQRLSAFGASSDSVETCGGGCHGEESESNREFHGYRYVEVFVTLGDRFRYYETL